MYGEEAEVRLAGYHQTLHHIMQPLNNVMDDGVLILCGDGKQRLCFPRFATYIADYEEQRQLASILSGYCPNVLFPRSDTDPTTSIRGASVNHIFPAINTMPSVVERCTKPTVTSRRYEVSDITQ